MGVSAGNWMLRWSSPCLIALVACGDAQRSPVDITVRDSSGVEIVEHRTNLWDVEPAWHIDSVADLRIGQVDGEVGYLFDGISGVVPLSDGRIVVANTGDGTLRWFDAEGRLTQQRGGAGDGPGEFGRLSAITSGTADTVVALDWANHRLTPFGSDGGIGATIPITGLTAPPGSAYRLSSGAWVVGPGGSSTAQLGRQWEPGIRRFDSPMLRLSADGAAVDTLGLFPGQETEVRTTDTGFTFGPPTFGRRTVYAVIADQIVIGTANRLQLEMYDTAGEHTRSIRAPDVDVSLSPDAAEAYRAYLRDRLADATPEERAAGNRRIAGMTFPDSVPAYSIIVADGDEHVWVGEYRPDFTPPQRYLVFNRDGRYVTTVRVAEGLRVLAVTRDAVWGRVTDDLDVQYIVKHRLTRS